MGRVKAALELDGEAMLSRVVRALRDGGCAPVLVVVGPPHDELTTALARAAGAAVARNPEPSRGMLSSLRVALAALSGDETIGAAAVALVDQPHLGAGAVRAVVERARDTGALVVRPWLATPGGPRHGHPYVLARAAWAAVERAPDDGEGMRDVLRALAAATERVEVEDAAILEDLDTPASLSRA